MNRASDNLSRGSLHAAIAAAGRAAGLLRGVIVPLTLACLVFGQIAFSFLQFRFHVQHPSWIFWGILAVCVVAISFAYRRSFVLTGADGLFAAFMGILVVSFLLQGQAPMREFVRYAIFFISLPYLAGRLLDDDGIAVFMRASLVICALSLVIVVFELTQLPREMLAWDRIRLFATPADLQSLAGDPTTINIGAAAGGALTLAISRLFGKERDPTHWWKIMLLVLLAGCALDIALIAGSRASLIASLVAAMMAMALTGLRYLPQKLTVLAVLAVFAILPFSLNLISESRSELLVGKNAAGEAVADKMVVSPDSCERYGDSLSTRVGYLVSAARLFIQHPVRGIGPGNFGLEYCGNQKATFISPHNIVAQVFVELGVFGGLAFCGAGLAGLFGAARQHEEPQRDAITAMTFFAVIAIFTGNMFTSYDFFAGLGILVAGGAMTRLRLLARHKGMA